MQSQRFGIMVTITAVVLAIAISSAVPQITYTYSVFAKSNAQNSGANNDCPADLVSIIIGVQHQASANCLNDTNMVQDSDGAAISSAPFNSAPNQAIELELGLASSPPPSCEDCFSPLLGVAGEARSVAAWLNLGSFGTDADAIEAICEALENAQIDVEHDVHPALHVASSLTPGPLHDILDCLFNLGL